MKIIHKDNPFFHILLENVFSVEELKIIFAEISELQSEFKEPEFTGTATKNNFLLKKNTGLFLHDYERCEELKMIKFIDNAIKKISDNTLWKNLAFKRLFNSLMWGSELINCYKKDDYYRPHADDGIFTLIFFLWEDMSIFDGGDLFFPEHDYLHECNSNTAIMFFSKEIHGVTPITECDDASSRYSIVSFSGMDHEDGLPKRSISTGISILYQ